MEEQSISTIQLVNSKLDYSLTPLIEYLKEYGSYNPYE